jgi:cytochrome c-type biogenesis protein CcmH/NrfG
VSRAFLVAVVTVGVAAASVLLLLNAARSDEATPSTATQRDLSQVTNEEMEEVVAANPDVVPMRLALVERYLDAGEIGSAHGHAQEALERATTPADRARSLRYVGWTIALLGRPADAETALRESLAVEPDHPDSLWFLARVLFEGQGRPADAVPVLEQILASAELPAAQRPSVQAKLDEARAAVAGGPIPTLPTVPG